MNYISLADYPTREKLLWWQKQHLCETPTGYGGKLRTTRQIFYAGKWRRVYCMCYSNLGTCYIIVNGKEQYVTD